MSLAELGPEEVKELRFGVLSWEGGGVSLKAVPGVGLAK